MQATTLLILAAGMGSRYGGLKQLDPVGPSGEVVLDYSVADAIRAGFTRVVFVIREEFAEEFRRTVGQRFAGRIAVDYAYQRLDDLPAGFAVPEGRSKPWGTGHAVLAAREVVKEPFAVVNADDFYGRDAFAQLGRFLGRLDPAAARYALVAYRLKNTLSENGTVSRGICEVSDEGKLVSVREMTKIARTPNGAENREDAGQAVALSGEELVSLNTWGFSPALFSQLERLFWDFLAWRGQEEKAEFYLPAAIDALIQAEEAVVEVLETDAFWYGITYREDKPVVVAGISRLTDYGEYSSPLW